MASFIKHRQEDETYTVDLQDAAGANIDTDTELPLLNPTVAVTRFESGDYVDKSTEFNPNGISVTGSPATAVTFNLDAASGTDQAEGLYQLLVEADTTDTGRHLVALGTNGLPPSLFVTDDAGV